MTGPHRTGRGRRPGRCNQDNCHGVLKLAALTALRIRTGRGAQSPGRFSRGHNTRLTSSTMDIIIIGLRTYDAKPALAARRSRDSASHPEIRIAGCRKPRARTLDSRCIPSGPPSFRSMTKQSNAPRPELASRPALPENASTSYPLMPSKSLSESRTARLSSTTAMRWICLTGISKTVPMPQK